MVEITCRNPKCKHKWDYKGDALRPTCPSCGNKTPNPAGRRH